MKLRNFDFRIKKCDFDNSIAFRSSPFSSPYFLTLLFRITALASMLSTNARLSKISISESGIARDGCEKIVDGLTIGYGLPLTHLNLSGNPVEVINKNKIKQ